LLSVDDDWYARTAKVPVLHRWLRVQKRSCRIAGKQAYKTLRYKPPVGPIFSMSQSFRSTGIWCPCNSRGMNKEIRWRRELNSGTISRCFFGSIIHGIIDLCLPSSCTLLTMSLLDFRYLQFGLCRFETTRPFLILLFPVDRLHGA
jgi:hypothetical protein